MSLLLPQNSTLSLQFWSICNPLRLLKAKLPVCVALKWFPMHHHPMKVAIRGAILTAKEMPEHRRFQMGNLKVPQIDFNRFLTLWFTLLWGIEKHLLSTLHRFCVLSATSFFQKTEHRGIESWQNCIQSQKEEGRQR